MVPLNKQDEPYLEQKENMSTLQAEPGQRGIVAIVGWTRKASARRNRCGRVLPVRPERWTSVTSALSDQDGMNSLVKFKSRRGTRVGINLPGSQAHIGPVAQLDRASAF
jgi:hypothetical protein